MALERLRLPFTLQRLTYIMLWVVQVNSIAMDYCQKPLPGGSYTITSLP